MAFWLSCKLPVWGFQFKTGPISEPLSFFKIYRIFPGGDIEFLHPKDGVFSEKVNEGREKVGHNPRRIGENPNPAGLKFTTKNTFD